MNRPQLPDRAGLAMGFGAYALWGLLPLYIHALRAVPPLQLLAHRVLWSLLLVVVIVLLLRRTRALIIAARGRTLALLALSAALIGGNWWVYIWAVEYGHVLEASLGYFICPLVNVALGIAVLGERLRRFQLLAILVAAVGVGVLAIVGGGSALWIALALAVTFAVYGLVRKVAAIDALGGLTIETILLAPAAAVLLADASMRGHSAFGQTITNDVLLALAGVVTAVPLLLFAAGARRLPLVSLGLLQYVAPTVQFLLAVLVFDETVATAHWLAFPLIWAGCLIYAYDGVRAARTMPAAPPE